MGISARFLSSSCCTQKAIAVRIKRSKNCQSRAGRGSTLHCTVGSPDVWMRRGANPDWKSGESVAVTERPPSDPPRVNHSLKWGSSWLRFRVAINPVTDYFRIYARVFAHQRLDAPREFPENERLNNKNKKKGKQKNNNNNWMNPTGSNAALLVLCAVTAPLPQPSFYKMHR